MSTATLTSLPPPWVSILAVFLLPILSLFFFMGKNTQYKKGLKLPPGPRKLPIIGNLHQLGDRPYYTFWKMSQKYGPVMQVQLGQSPAIVVSGAEASREVMKDHDLEYCSRPLSVGPGRLSYNFLDVALSPYSDYWKEMKKLLISELLSMKSVHKFWYAREEQIDKLNDILTNAYPNTVNLTEKVFNVIDGIISTAAFGRNYGAEVEFKQDFVKVISDALDMLNSFHAEDFFLSAAGRFVDSLTGALAKREQVFRNLDGFFEKILDQHLDPERPKPENEDVVDALIGLMRDQSASFQITKDHLKAILMDIFLGGVDTSAITTSWAFSEMLKNPRIMKKAHEEIRRIVGPNKKRVEGRDIDKSKYLELIVRETLRKHPPLPLLLPHFCTKDCKIGGYDILSGTTVFINAYALGRDPTLWDNPEEFYPERFEKSEVDYRGSHFEFVPFGAGRRICPGMAMGITAVKYILCNLLYGFDYELPNGMKFEDFPLIEDGGLTIHNRQDLVVIPKKHKWD